MRECVRSNFIKFRPQLQGLIVVVVVWLSCLINGHYILILFIFTLLTVTILTQSWVLGFNADKMLTILSFRTEWLECRSSWKLTTKRTLRTGSPISVNSQPDTGKHKEMFYSIICFKCYNSLFSDEVLLIYYGRWKVKVAKYGVFVAVLLVEIVITSSVAVLMGRRFLNFNRNYNLFSLPSARQHLDGLIVTSSARVW